MKKNQRRIQITLASIGLLLFVLTYLYYPNISKDKLFKKQSTEKDLDEVVDDQATILYNVKYLGHNLKTPFTLRAETAKINKEENPDLVALNNLHLILHLKDRQIDVYAKNGNFNKLTNNVYMMGAPGDPIQAIETPGTTVIYAGNINLLATSNEAEIYNNVNVVDDKGSFLRAHSIRYDFLLKQMRTTSNNNENIKIKVIN